MEKHFAFSRICKTVPALQQIPIYVQITKYSSPVVGRVFSFHDYVIFISSNVDLCWLFLNPAHHSEEVIIVAADLQLAQDGDNVKVYDGNGMDVYYHQYPKHNRFNTKCRLFYFNDVMWCYPRQHLRP